MSQMRPDEALRQAVADCGQPMPGVGPIKQVFGMEGEVFAVRSNGWRDALFLLLADGSWLEIVRN